MPTPTELVSASHNEYHLPSWEALNPVNAYADETGFMSVNPAEVIEFNRACDWNRHLLRLADEHQQWKEFDLAQRSRSLAWEMWTEYNKTGHYPLSGDPKTKGPAHLLPKIHPGMYYRK